MRPDVGSSKPPIMRRVVVLPQPDGPSSEKNSPSRTSRSMWSTATTSPNFLTTSTSRTSTSVVTVASLLLASPEGCADRSPGDGASRGRWRASSARVHRRLPSCSRWPDGTRPRKRRRQLVRIVIGHADPHAKDRRGRANGDSARGRRDTMIGPGATPGNARVPAPEGTDRQMSTLTEAAVLDALRTVQEPELGRDIVTLNMVKDDRHRRAEGRLHDRADHAGLPAQGRDRAQRPGRAGRDRCDRRRDHLGRDGPPRAAAPGRSSSLAA